MLSMVERFMNRKSLFLPSFMFSLVGSLLAASLVLGNDAWACLESLRSDPELCKASDDYVGLRKNFQENHSLNIESLAEYRAMRFIDRNSWERSVASGNHLPWLVYKPSPTTWQYWESGEKFRKALQVQEEFGIADLKGLHKHGISWAIMSKWATLLKGAGPGRIRSHFWQMAPSFELACKDKVDRVTFTRFINSDLRDRRGNLMIRAVEPVENRSRHQGYQHMAPGYGSKAWIDQFKCADGQSYSSTFSYLGSSKVPVELQIWIDQFADFRKSALHNQNLEEPISQIASLQRKFVAIHPFGDGNGRVSRWLQDMLFDYLDLPHPPSGDLQDDLISDPADYAARMRMSVIKTVALLSACYQQYQVGQEISLRCKNLALEKLEEVAPMAEEELIN